MTLPDGDGNFTVLQVKFSRNPLARDSREEFIESIGRIEKEKIDILRSRGLTNYILATNVQGTAHFENGSIDRAQQTLSEIAGIEAQCWWRDDIERRIEKHPEVKWSFIEILDGSDVLGMLIGGGNRHYNERTFNALKAFMAHQYEKESHAKFKQLDLDKDILSLFIDLPIEINVDENDRSHQAAKLQETIDGFETKQTFQDDEFKDLEIPGENAYESNPLCVELFLDPDFSANANRIVIEGAPGQGKSTITQFLCQVYRMQLLFPFQLDRVPSHLRPNDIVLPLRFDLRDYAQWLMGRNPWATGRESSRPIDAADLLEAFIIAQIKWATGHEISVGDFAVFSQGCRLLIALDGFDEIADPKLRERIVEQISQAYVRLHASALSLKVIVASRPTAFIDSPGFPSPEWLHVSLASLTSREISDYSRNWFTAMKLPPQTRAAILGTLREKLPHSHIAYLAKNPMQLSILLALVWKQGAHLPDKRTALYDKYIETFLDREAEKSELVRDNRDLLINIHGYLALCLQLESERDQSAGKITQDRLRILLEDFLRKRRFSLEILDSIFTGVTQRVVAIVSRAAGTYEFEVQPLQEYFSARYLYSNARYTRDSHKKGAIHDIFQVICTKYFWINTARFFAGYYNSGELPSLVFDLNDIQESTTFKNTAHVTRIKLNLLSDHVFSQRPSLIPKIVEPILQNDHFDLLLSKINANDADFAGSYPWGPSKQTVIEHCLTQLKQDQKSDRRIATARFLSQALTKDESIHYWQTSIGTDFGADIQLLLASEIGIIERLDDAQLRHLVELHGDHAVFYILKARRHSTLDRDPELWLRVLDGLRSGVEFPTRHPHDAISNFGAAMLMLADLVKIPSGAMPSVRKSERPIGALYPRWRTLIGATYPSSKAAIVEGAPASASPIVVKTLLELYDLLSSRVSELRDNPSTLGRFLNSYQSLLGQGVIFEMLAVRLVDLIRFEEIDLHHPIENNVLKFVIEATINRRNRDWWKSVLSLNGDHASVSPTLRLSCFLQLIRRPIVDYAIGIGELIASLSSAQWNEFVACYSSYRIPIQPNLVGKVISEKDFALSGASGARLLGLSLLRNRPTPTLDLLRTHFPNPEACDIGTISIIASHLEIAARDAEFGWREALPYFAAAHSRDVTIRLRRFSRRAMDVPRDVATEVCSRTHLYPLSLLEVCERSLADEAGRRGETVAEISTNEEWFADE